VGDALSAGWAPAALADFVGANTAGVRSPAAVLAARLSPSELPPPPDRAQARQPWCGACDESTRMLGRYGDDVPSRCPRCHPLATGTGDTGAEGRAPEAGKNPAAQTAVSAVQREAERSASGGLGAGRDPATPAAICAEPIGAVLAVVRSGAVGATEADRRLRALGHAAGSRADRERYAGSAVPGSLASAAGGPGTGEVT
jgi:hypothetical protein